VTPSHLEDLRQEWRKRLNHALERLIPEKELQELDQAFGAPTAEERARLEAEKAEVRELEKAAAVTEIRRAGAGWTTKRRLRGGP